MHAVVVQETPRDQQPDALDELYHLWVVDHRHVEHSVVGHGTGCLAVAGTLAHAYGHHAAVYDIAVDAQAHLIVHPMEEHDE